MGKKNKQYIKDDLYRSEPKFPNQKITFSVQMPPSINHMYIPTARGGKVLSKDAKRWVVTTQRTCVEAIESQEWKDEDKHVWFWVDMEFYFPDRRKRDNHNCFKILFDAMENIVYNNDYFILPRVMDVQLDRKNPRVEITVYPRCN